MNQLSSMDIHFSFLCRSSHRYKNGQHPIVLRVMYRGQRKDVFTGLTCLLEHWNHEHKLVHKKCKSSTEINRQIQQILFDANQVFMQMKYAGDEFTIDELIDAMKGKTPPPQTISEYIEMMRKEIDERVSLDITRSTFNKYNRSMRYFIEFLQHKKSVKNIPVSKIDGDMVKDFFQFLRKEKNNQVNAAIGLLSCFKTILLPAVKNKTIKYNPFTEFKVKRKNVDREFLNIEELQALHSLESMNKDLTLKRDLFLFACYTGLAYIDVQLFSRKDICLDNDGSFYIKHPRVKTSITSIIPLLPLAEKILKKYSPTGDCRDFDWKVMSNQKLNSGLKVLAKLAKIDKPLFMHLG
jgi:site-specific recombinase XerD